MLYETTKNLIQTQKPIIFDLYAGTGTIGMIVANEASQVYSVEIVPSASEDNIRNLAKNSITNVQVINAPVEKFLKDWKAGSIQTSSQNPDVIIIDPPRAGMHPDAPDIIRQFSPAEIIYVSCNPATLARDLVILCGDKEYTLTDIAPIDMFPHTHHIETVVRLQKNKT